MPYSPRKLARIALPVLALASLYALAVHKHAQREEIRQAAVTLTPGCSEKLARYALAAGPEYVSPYVVQRTGSRIELLYRQSLWETIGGGTSEIMRGIVAKQALGL